ncbi:MAG TPA: AMP-binding protein [Candidatus Binatia bacterium]|nr:AMP-binding protein [Candidatus Binatia bacterium]
MPALAGLLGAAPRYAALLRSQYWSAARLGAYTAQRLRDVLAAAARVPFYAARFGGVPGPADLERLPILRRADVAALEDSVRALHPSGTPFLRDRSSGSSGMPVSFLFDGAHQHGRFAARARYLRANGWSPLRRSAWIISLPQDSPDAELVASPTFPGASFLSHVTEFAEQLRWLRRLDPVHLYTLPSNLEALAGLVAASGEPLRSLRGVFTGGEVLDDAVRARAERALGVRVADNYGSTEAFLAWQCPHGSYHVNAEHVLLEIVDDGGRPVGDGDMGRVLATTLENRLMPLVRYEIGDWATPADGPCACGRTLPRIGSVVGRGINLFRMPDGRLRSPWRLVGPLKNRPQLRQFQIVQRSVERYTVRYAGDSELTGADEAAIGREFREILGYEAAVDFERLTTIPRAPSGKFMTALSEVATRSA